MSSDPSSEYDALVRTLVNFTAATDCTLAAYTFLLYDYAITFGQEVELFWRRKTNTGTILYFASRYLALVWYTINVIGSVSMSDKSCELFVKSIAIIRYAQYLPWAMFSALRALALSQQWSLAVLVLLLSLVPFAINITSYSFGATGVNVPPFGCSEIDSVSPALAQKFTIASRTCLIMADIILIVITWRTTHKTAGLRFILQQRSSFGDVLLGDGLLYFVVLVVLNATHLTCTLLSISGLSSSLGGYSYITLFTEPVTSILVSRFLMDLQLAQRGGLSTLDTSRCLTPMFERIVGAIGSSIPAHSLDSDTHEGEVYSSETRADNGADSEDDRISEVLQHQVSKA